MTEHVYVGSEANGTESSLFCSLACMGIESDPNEEQTIFQGEVDSPQSCTTCHKFLKLPMTEEGIKSLYGFVTSNIRDCDYDIIWEWCDFYGLTDKVRKYMDWYFDEDRED